MVLFVVPGLACGLQSATKMLLLSSWLEIHVTGQHRYINDERHNDIVLGQWSLRMRDTHP